ncbi:MAG: type II CAAX endopeptidase family protein [Chloroflexota bacterium]
MSGGFAERVRSGFTAAPAYPPSDADRRTVRIAGLDLPLLATTAIAVAVFVLLFDFTRTFIPEPVQDLGRAAPAIRYNAIERAILFGLIPLLVVVFAFRDRPSAYGLRLGDWRWGAGLAGLGCLVMTPLVLILAAQPDFRDYYAISWAPTGDLLLTYILDLASAEFLFRGFLLFALLRAMGPIGLVVATIPFVFVHLGKPEVELFSTMLGGLVFGWLNWRTGSIVWSAAAHIYILTLAVAAVGPPG